MKRLIIAAGAALIAAITLQPALAADIMPRKAPLYTPPPPPFVWTGFYFGGNGGYGWAQSNWSNDFTTGNPKPNGWLFGGTLGYNLQTGVWVWGLEGDVDITTIKGATAGGTGLCSAGCETRNRWMGTARGRIGYAMDRFMPYLTGGAAFGDIKMSAPSGEAETKTKIGWTAGAGLEYGFANNFSAKIEYLYVDLGKSSCSAATCGADTDVTFNANTVRLGLNYHF